MYEAFLKKKRTIIQLVKKCNNLMNKPIILELLNNRSLDSHINKLKEERIDIIYPTIVEKKYLTSYEQYIYILDIFIDYMLKLFNSIELVRKVLPTLLKIDNDIWFNKEYYYVSFNSNKYIKEFDKIIVNNFYNNCLRLKDEFSNFFVLVDIDINKCNINNYDDCNKLLNLIEELYFINRNRYSVISLFEIINDDNHNFLSAQYDRLFYHYDKNITFIREYRKFKENNNFIIE